MLVCSWHRFRRLRTTSRTVEKDESVRYSSKVTLVFCSIRFDDAGVMKRRLRKVPLINSTETIKIKAAKKRFVRLADRPSLCVSSSLRRQNGLLELESLATAPEGRVFNASRFKTFVLLPDSAPLLLLLRRRKASITCQMLSRLSRFCQSKQNLIQNRRSSWYDLCPLLGAPNATSPPAFVCTADCGQGSCVPTGATSADYVCACIPSVSVNTNPADPKSKCAIPAANPCLSVDCGTAGQCVRSANLVDYTCQCRPDAVQVRHKCYRRRSCGHVEHAPGGGKDVLPYQSGSTILLFSEFRSYTFLVDQEDFVRPC